MVQFYALSKKFRLVALVMFIAGTVSAQSINFTSYTLESGTAFQQGAVYRFSNVCTPGTVDALVTVTSHHRVQLKSIVSSYTGDANAFQPQLRSNSGTGDHYAVFNITFVTAGTSTPISIANFTGTVFDLNGSNQINEYTTISLANSSWAYANGTPAISVTQTGNDITGVSNNNNLGATIDTANKSNSFVVSTSAVSSFDVRFGFNQSNTGWNGNDNFSILFNGVAPAGILPLLLRDFTAHVNGSKVDLKWSTSMEKDFSHFLVQRSVDGRRYENIGIVFSNDNGTSNKYQFVDETVNPSGVVYYRLMTVDINEEAKLSPVRLVNFGTSKSVNVQVYPNPVVSEVRVSIPASWQNSKVSYRLFESNGKEVLQVARANANQTEVLPMNSLKAGLYILTITSGNQTITKQVLKSK